MIPMIIVIISWELSTFSWDLDLQMMILMVIVNNLMGIEHILMGFRPPDDDPHGYCEQSHGN
jgi:hypothetical protein